MGYDLRSNEGYFHLTSSEWSKIQQLALSGGWQPIGTKFNADFYIVVHGATENEVIEDTKEWSGNYWSNDYQLVTDQDAGNLAAALAAVLDDVSDIKSPKWEIIDSGPLTGTWHMDSREAENCTPYEYFSGNKERLQAFIDFCKAGEFAIG